MSEPKDLYYFSKFLPNPEAIFSYFISEDFQKYLSPISSSPNSRRVAHFGFHYDYLNGDIKAPAPDFPPMIEELRQKILQDCQEYLSDKCLFNQCIVNCYLPGQGISAHADRFEYGNEIACLTAISGAEMEFIRRGHPTHKLYVEPGSLYLMKNESRYIWKHQMKCRKADPGHGSRGVRYSVTFRTVEV